MPDTPNNKVLTALNDITILTPVALSLLAAIKKAIDNGNGSMTVDELIADAEAGWDKAQADLNALEQEGHEAQPPA